MRAYSNIRKSPSNVTNPGVDEISYTAIYKLQRSTYQYENLIPVYTKLYLVYCSMAELSMVIEFQMRRLARPGSQSLSDRYWQPARPLEQSRSDSVRDS